MGLYLSDKYLILGGSDERGRVRDIDEVLREEAFKDWDASQDRQIRRPQGYIFGTLL